MYVFFTERQSECPKLAADILRKIENHFARSARRIRIVKNREKGTATVPPLRKKRGRELVRAAFWAKPETAPRFFTLSDAFGATFWHQKAVEHATSEFPKREFPRFPIVHIFFVLLACPESSKRSSTANYLRHSVP